MAYSISIYSITAYSIMAYSEDTPMNQPDIQHNNTKRSIIIADIGLLLVALFWGGGFVAGKFGLTILPPLTLTAYRYMGAATVLFVFCLNKLQHFKNKKVWLYGLFCGINMFIGNSMQTIGLLYTTAGKQSFIVSLYILLVPLLSWVFLRKRPANSVIVAALIGFAGIALITLTDSFTVGKGDLLTFALSLTFSIQMIFTAAVVRNIDATVFTFVQLLVVGLLSSAAALIMEDPVMPAEVAGMALPGVLGLVYVMTFNSAFAFLLQNICLRFAPANHAAILLSLETVFGTIFAVTVAGEVFSARMIAGCVLMFLAIGIVEAGAVRKG